MVLNITILCLDKFVTVFFIKLSFQINSLKRLNRYFYLTVIKVIQVYRFKINEEKEIKEVKFE